MDMPQAITHKPPAVVIIVRHGARMDAVDKEWHVKSPTPYDPPLTYGGWLQGRALGARIASLLKAREISVHDDAPPPASSSSTTINSTTTDLTSEGTHSTNPKKVRKHSVIVHSSPFLRCVQTSVAISAGISQYYGTENEHTITQTPSPSPSPLLSSPIQDVSPLSTPPPSSTPSPADQGTRHTGKDKPTGQGKRTKATVPRTRLRIDAFLGEWLSSDYFEKTTAPPASAVMVASAKAELLRRGETLHRGHNSGSRALSGHFPGGWQSNQSPTSPDFPEETGPFGMSVLANALPEIRQANDDGLSHHRPNRVITIRDVLSRTPSHSHEDFSEGYVPPVPSYAISPSDPIPDGYVTHARDACVDIDYQWDSMKGPQNWGDGGEYGEEWSAMHKRFRSGLVRMLDWYSHERPQHQHHHHHQYHHEEDSDTDIVVVLVTHAAGCNALIGALTNQPVLIDVAVGSLTMAVRKDVFKTRDSSPEKSNASNDEEAERRLSTSATPLYRLYNVSLVASTEHLRATSNPLAIPQLPTPILERSRSISTHRHRGDSSPIQFTNSNDKLSQITWKHGLRRSATINASPNNRPTRSGFGLWNSSSANHPSSSSSTENEKVILEETPDNRPERPKLRTSFETIKPTNGSQPEKIVSDSQSPLSSFSQSSFPTSNQLYEQLQEQQQKQPKSQLGLWSSSSSSAAFAQAREPAVKRRWTVTDQQR